jgi:hypothetical protein
VPIHLASSPSLPPSSTSFLSDLFLQKPADATALLVAVSALAIVKAVLDGSKDDPYPRFRFPGLSCTAVDMPASPPNRQPTLNGDTTIVFVALTPVPGNAGGIQRYTTMLESS